MIDKQNVSARISKDLIAYVDEVANQNQTSRSKTLELFIDIIQQYFTQDQLWAEYNARDDRDGRKKSGV